MAFLLLIMDEIRMARGVATGWTVVDMSTPVLPEVVPEIGEFLRGRGEVVRSDSVSFVTVVELLVSDYCA